MGIVIRQSLKASAAAYIGVALGVINNLFVATRFLSPEQLAISRLLLENSLIFASFAHWGLPFVVDKFFVFYRNEKHQNYGFLGILLGWAIISMSLFAVLYWLMREEVSAYFQRKSADILGYHFLAVPLTACWIFITVLEAYIRNSARIAIPAAIREIFLKSANIGLILIYGVGWISFDIFLYMLVGIYLLAVGFLMIYIRLLGKWFWRVRWDVFSGSVLKKMWIYGAVVAIGGVGENIFRFADRVMLAGQEGLRESAIFMLATFIVMTMDIPKRALSQISIHLLSKAIVENDRMKIKELYQKTALNQLIVGGFVFLGIWLCIDEIFVLIPKGKIYAEGKGVVLILGLTTLFNLATGLRGELILYSEKYYYTSIFSFVFACLNIFLNYWLIDWYGVQGAAMATAITTILMLSIHVFWVLRMYGLLPFQSKQIMVLFVGGLVWGIVSLLPSATNYTMLLWVLPLKVFLICFLYWGLIVSFSVSAELNQLVFSFCGKIKDLIRI